MREQLVARFESAGDERRMFVGAEGEKIVVREELSGPSVLVSYGEERKTLRVSLEADAVSALLAAIGFLGSDDSLWDYLASERHDIVDLMDLCDQRGIPYEFSSVGTSGDCQLRPATRGAE